MNKQTVGLRERKRIETRKKLEAATIELVVRDGLEQASIEAIAERANVSPRTFFNYFDSKEEAVLGLYDITIDEDVISEHIRTHCDSTVLESLVSLILQVIAPALTDPALHESRMQVIRQHPQLLERQISRMNYMAKQFTGATKRVARAASGGDIDDVHAEVLLALCIGGVRVVMREWITAGKKASPKQLEQQVIQMISEVTSRI